MTQSTPQDRARLSAAAGHLYAHESLFNRLLTRYRPHICPFDRVIAHVPAEAKVVDVGCGRGLLLALLHEQGAISAGTGFDPSDAAIEAAQRMASTRGAASLTFVCAGAGDDWPEGNLDAVLLVDVMHHLPPDLRPLVIQRAARALRMGGRLIYKDMCIRPLWRRALNRLHDLVLARQWIREEPIERVERWAEEQGLERIAAERTDLWWYGHELRVFERRA